MSSRILSQDQAEKVTPIQWKRIAGTPPAEMAPAAGNEPRRQSIGSPPKELEARIKEIEASFASREAKARQEGLQQGRAEAEQKLAAPLEEAARRMAGHIAELASMRPRLRRQAEEDLVKLAIAIARRVLRRELTADPSAILGIVKAALDKVDSREILQVRVHPQTLELIREALEMDDLPERVELVADRGLEPGGIVVETKRGNLDASVETQLAEIERGFTDLVRRRSD